MDWLWFFNCNSKSWYFSLHVSVALAFFSCNISLEYQLRPRTYAKKNTLDLTKMQLNIYFPETFNLALTTTHELVKSVGVQPKYLKIS